MSLAMRSRSAAFRPAASCFSRQARRTHCRADESKVSREYNEAEGKVSAPETGGPDGKGTKNADGNYYVDELPKNQRDDPMSAEFKQKLREQYVGFGGSPNQPLAGNYFLYIIAGVTILILLCYALGYIPGPGQLSADPASLGAI